MKLLAAFFGLYSMMPVAATALPPSPPTTLVIIACQVVETGERDDTTGWIGLEWRFKDSEMQCKREVIALEDTAVLNGARPLGNDFSQFAQCAKAAMQFSPEWNRTHRGWAVLKVGCPRPIVDGEGHILGWHMPECPIGIKCRFDESVI